jgi:transcriptional regulator with XRE-family HTH domain
MRALRKTHPPATDPERELSYDVAEQVFNLRNEQNLSQTELADRVGTKQPAISRLESAAGLPTLGLLVRIAKALGRRLVIRFEKPEDSE